MNINQFKPFILICTNFIFLHNRIWVFYMNVEEDKKRAMIGPNRKTFALKLHPHERHIQYQVHLDKNIFQLRVLS